MAEEESMEESTEDPRPAPVGQPKEEPKASQEPPKKEATEEAKTAPQQPEPKSDQNQENGHEESGFWARVSYFGGIIAVLLGIPTSLATGVIAYYQWKAADVSNQFQRATNQADEPIQLQFLRATGNLQVTIINASQVGVVNVELDPTVFEYSEACDTIFGSGTFAVRREAHLNPFESKDFSIELHGKPSDVSYSAKTCSGFTVGPNRGSNAPTCSKSQPCVQILWLRARAQHEKTFVRTPWFEEFYKVREDGTVTSSRSLGASLINDHGRHLQWKSERDRRAFGALAQWLKTDFKQQEEDFARADTPGPFWGMGLETAVAPFEGSEPTARADYFDPSDLPAPKSPTTAPHQDLPNAAR